MLNSNEDGVVYERKNGIAREIVVVKNPGSTETIRIVLEGSHFSGLISYPSDNDLPSHSQMSISVNTSSSSSSSSSEHVNLSSFSSSNDDSALNTINQRFGIRPVESTSMTPSQWYNHNKNRRVILFLNQVII